MGSNSSKYNNSNVLKLLPNDDLKDDYIALLFFVLPNVRRPILYVNYTLN